MATTSMTEKKPTKRGRPKKEGLLREPNGRISRSKHAIYQHTLEKKAKKYNLTLEQAADPRSDTYLGRLVLRGKEDGLSEEQYQAAIKFLKIYNDYKKSTLPENAYYEGKTLGTNYESQEYYKKWVVRVQQKYKQTLKAIEEAQFDNNQENLHAALQYVIIENSDFPHLLGAARMVLNALHRHYNLTKKKQNTFRYYNRRLSGIDRRENSDLYTSITNDGKEQLIPIKGMFKTISDNKIV